MPGTVSIHPAFVTRNHYTAKKAKGLAKSRVSVKKTKSDELEWAALLEETEVVFMPSYKRAYVINSFGTMQLL